MSDTQPKMAIRTTAKPLATEYDVMFDKIVEGPAEVQEELYIMRQAGEGDLVNLRVNTDGGRVCTVAAVQGIIEKSKAHFHAILEGDASSAGSMLFLLGDTQEVYPLATMYIHTCQSGMSGHSQEMKAYGKFSGDLAEKLVRFIYSDFLSEEEIKEVLLGGVIWLQSEEINQRLANREAIRHQREVDAAKEEYTPEIYASQILEDISEDCETFGYSVEEILSLAKSMLTVVEEEEQLPNAEPDEDDVFKVLDKDYILRMANFAEIKEVADTLLIKYPHNIGFETLRKKVLDFLEN